MCNLLFSLLGVTGDATTDLLTLRLRDVLTAHDTIYMKLMSQEKLIRVSAK